MAPTEEALTAPHVLEYAYTRSTGPIIGAFMTGLRERRVVGIRAADGRVLVPPQEYDPQTSDALSELVDVASEGTVSSWSWNSAPRPGQPLNRPFAWALVLLDGADTPLLHALDVPAPSAVQTGMRVRIRWADDRQGSIHDIACFEPGERIRMYADSSPLGDESKKTEGSGGGDEGGDAEDAEDPGDVTMVTTPVRLEYRYTAGPTSEAFLRGTQERKLLGRRCSRCRKVYLPPRGVCSMCGAPFTDEIVEVSQIGTVSTFAIVNVNFASREVDLPYAAVEVVFDGANTTAQFLILGVSHDQVRMGMRVRAVWKEGALEPTLSNVTHVEPVDEPDTPYEQFAEYV
jgi:uncharacterized OB-fold protein